MSSEAASKASPAAASPLVTAWLDAWREGDLGARERLVEALYGELRTLAGHRMRGERHRLTLETTALVHETFLRLAGIDRVNCRDRQHFLALAALVMRRVLVDRARERGADRRGGGAPHASLDGVIASTPTIAARDVELLDLDRALERFAVDYPRAARVLELRYFGGLEEGEIAELVEVSIRTVRRDWAFAAAWLARELDPARAAAEAVPVR